MTNETMNRYMVITRIDNLDFITKVQARNLVHAEQIILEQVYVGKHKPSIGGCIAYDSETMKTETFIYKCLASIPIDYDSLCRIIRKANEELKRDDEREEEIEKIEKQISKLTEKLNALKGGE